MECALCCVGLHRFVDAGVAWCDISDALCELGALAFHELCLLDVNAPTSLHNTIDVRKMNYMQFCNQEDAMEFDHRRMSSSPRMPRLRLSSLEGYW